MILEGFCKGEKVLYVSSENSQQDLRTALTRKSLWPSRSLAEAVEVLQAEDVYLENGVFEPERVLGFWRKKLLEAKHQGFVGLRVFGEMSWILGHPNDQKALTAYEVSFGLSTQDLSIFGACMYNPTRLGYELVRKAFADHPVIHI